MVKSKRRLRDPYNGQGDFLVGTCDGKGCGREIRRRDAFVITLSNHVICRKCWESPIGEWLPDNTDGMTLEFKHENLTGRYEPVNESPKSEPDNRDYGPDNPYF